MKTLYSFLLMTTLFHTTHAGRDTEHNKKTAAKYNDCTPAIAQFKRERSEKNKQNRHSRTNTNKQHESKYEQLLKNSEITESTRQQLLACYFLSVNNRRG